MEREIGGLNGELKVLRHESKGNLTEYARNKSAMANMRRKFSELRTTRDLLRSARAEIYNLKAALAEERANPLPGREVSAFPHRTGFKQAPSAIRPFLRGHDCPRDAQHGVDAGTDQRDPE